MFSIASDQIGIVIAIFVVTSALVVMVVSRRAAAKHVLRTICPRCKARFEARARLDLLGFREMTCTECGATGPYPLSTAMVVTYAVLTAAACVAVVVKLVTGPEFTMREGFRVLWVLLFPFVLVQNRRIWRKLRVLASNSGSGFVPMQRVTSAER